MDTPEWSFLVTRHSMAPGGGRLGTQEHRVVNFRGKLRLACMSFFPALGVVGVCEPPLLAAKPCRVWPWPGTSCTPSIPL